MTIAELFVNLGIKGTEKTVGALASVKKGLGEVGSMSLEAKAGILAAMYGLERMMSISGAAGTNLTNFSALTGMSAQELQKWQYAARQAGLSGQEMEGSLKGVQNVMTNMMLGKGAPEGMGIISRAVGFDPKRARDTFYVMQKLQEAAQKLPKDVGNNLLKSFGLSEGVIAAMRRNEFNPSVFKRAPTYSDGEIGQLDKANIAWSNLGQKIEMAFGHLNAKHGLSLVTDISKITDSLLKLSDTLLTIGDRLKIFQVVDTIFKGWNEMLGLINGQSVDQVTKGDKKRHFGDNTWWMNGINAIEDKLIDLNTVEPNSIAARQMTRKEGQGNTTISQNIVHHGDAKDTKAVRDIHKAAISHAYRQRSAARQGS